MMSDIELHKECRKDAAYENYRRQHGGMAPVGVWVVCDCPDCRRMKG